MIDPLPTLARETAEKWTNEHVDQLAPIILAALRQVREATEAEIAADPDRYKGFKVRIIAQAHAQLVQAMETLRRFDYFERFREGWPGDTHGIEERPDGAFVYLHEVLALLRRSK